MTQLTDGAEVDTPIVITKTAGGELVLLNNYSNACNELYLKSKAVCLFTRMETLCISWQWNPSHLRHRPIFDLILSAVMYGTAPAPGMQIWLHSVCRLQTANCT